MVDSLGQRMALCRLDLHQTLNTPNFPAEILMLERSRRFYQTFCAAWTVSGA